MLIDERREAHEVSDVSPILIIPCIGLIDGYNTKGINCNLLGIGWMLRIKNEITERI